MYYKFLITNILLLIDILGLCLIPKAWPELGRINAEGDSVELGRSWDQISPEWCMLRWPEVTDRMEAKFTARDYIAVHSYQIKKEKEEKKGWKSENEQQYLD